MSKRGEALLIAAGVPFKKRDDKPMGHDGGYDGGHDMPDDGDGDEDGDEPLSEGEQAAAEECMAAAKSDDAEAYGKALKRFLAVAS